MKPHLLFHISPVKLIAGTILRGKDIRHVSSQVEGMLNSSRPNIATISRFEAVSMARRPDFVLFGLHYDSGYIHLVQPLGPVQEHDLFWFGHLQLRHELNNTRLKDRSLKQVPLSSAELCEKYWLGEASGQPTWECLSKEAKVIGYLCTERIRIAATKGGRLIKLIEAM